MTLIAVALLAATLLASLYLRWRKWVACLSAMPGPSKSVLMHRRSQRELACWADDYGPVYKLWLGPLPLVIVADSHIAHDVLKRKGPEAMRRAMETSYSALKEISSAHSHANMFTSTDEAWWKQARKTLMPAFGSASVKEAFNANFGMRDKAVRLAGLFQAAGGEPVEALHKIMRFTMDLTIDTLLKFPFDSMSYSGDPRVEAIHEATTFVLEETAAHIRNPIRAKVIQALRVFGAGADYERHKAVLHSLFLEIARSIRARPLPAESENSIADCLARLRDPKTGEPLADMERLGAEVSVHFVAGVETSAVTLSWILYEVARNRRIQDKLVAELSEAGLLRSGSSGEEPPRQLQYEDLFALPYLNQVVREGMRRYPAAPIAGMRVTTAPTRVGGFDIPAGVAVFHPPYAMHNCERNYADPLSFIPERWDPPTKASRLSGRERLMSLMAESRRPLRSSSSDSAMDFQGMGSGAGAADKPNQAPEIKRADSPLRILAAKQLAERAGSVSGSTTPIHLSTDKAGDAKGYVRENFMPFSAGPRDCLGQRLALAVVHTGLITLLSTLEFEVAECMGSKEDVLAGEIMLLTLQSEKGIWLKCKPRTPAAASS